MLKDYSVRFYKTCGLALGISAVIQNFCIAAPLTKIVTLSCGSSWLVANKIQTLTLLPPFSNRYSIADSNHQSSVCSVFLGLEKQISAKYFVQFGLAGYANSSTKISGTITQLGFPNPNVLQYDYHVQRYRLVAEGKAFTTIKQHLHPYLTANIGLSSIKAYQYQERSSDPRILPMLPFGKKTTNALTVGGGAGFDISISKSTRIGLAYQYSLLGQLGLNTSPAQATNATLKQNHVTNHEIKVQLTFIV
jgi:opacity protein-like surface antigen